MSESNTSETSAKLPLFDGKGENFQLWVVRFNAYAKVKKFKKALEQPNNLPETEDGDRNPDGTGFLPMSPEQKKAVEENDLAMASFTMAFTSPSLVRMVHASETPEWSDGRADILMKKLMKKYQPKDLVSKAELKKRITEVKMKKKESPTTLFEQLSELENEFDTELELEDKLAQVMIAAPKEYKGIIVGEQRAKGADLELDDVESAMTQFWRATYGGVENNQPEGDDSSDEDEVVLSAVNANKICWLCGKRGHVAAQCPNKPYCCEHCGKMGHTVNTCWDLEKNAHLRPEGWKGKNEVGAAGFESGHVEFVM